MPATFFYPAVSALLHPEEVRGVAADGHEIGIHSWIHEVNTSLTYEVERDLAQRAAEVLARLSGRAPVGMRTASWDFSVSTLRIVREMKLLYDSSLMADDDAYELLDGAEPTGIVELPPEWIRDDAVYFNMLRFSGLRPYTPPSAVEEIFAGRVRGRMAGGRAVPADHAPAHHRPPQPNSAFGTAGRAHAGARPMLVRDARAGGALVSRQRRGGLGYQRANNQ